MQVLNTLLLCNLP